MRTLEAAAVSIVLALIFGLVFGMGRLSHLAPVRWLCGTSSSSSGPCPCC